MYLGPLSQIALDTSSKYVNSLFSRTFFQDLFHNLCLFAGLRKSFTMRGIGCLISSCDHLLDLLRTSSLVTNI